MSGGDDEGEGFHGIVGAVGYERGAAVQGEEDVERKRKGAADRRSAGDGPLCEAGGRSDVDAGGEGAAFDGAGRGAGSLTRATAGDELLEVGDADGRVGQRAGDDLEGRRCLRGKGTGEQREQGEPHDSMIGGRAAVNCEGTNLKERDPETETEYSEDGVDLSLIRWMLSLTPAERLQFLQRQVNAIQAIRKLNVR